MSVLWALDGSRYAIKGCGVSTPAYDKRVRNWGAGFNLTPASLDQVGNQLFSRVSFIRHEIQGGGSFTEKADGTCYAMQGAQSNLLGYINRKWGIPYWILNTFAAPSSIYPAIANVPHHAKMIRPNGYGPVTSNNLSSPTSVQLQLWRDSIVKEIRALQAIGCYITVIATPNEYSTGAIPGDWWLAGGATSSAANFANCVYGGAGMSDGLGLKDIFPGLLLFNDDPNNSGNGYLIGNSNVYRFGIHDYAQYTTAIKGKGNTPPVIWYGEFSCTSFANTVARLNQAFADDTMGVELISWWCWARDMTIGAITAPNGLQYVTNFGLYNLNSNTGTVTPGSVGGLYPFLATLQAQGRYGGYSYTDAATGGGLSTRQPVANTVYVNAYQRNSDSKYSLKIGNTGGTIYSDTVSISLGGAGKPMSGTVRLFTASSEGAPSAASTDGSGNLTVSLAANTIAVYELS
ncbi:hypothetical protein CCAX7_54360 [Capsulimonas corticalis]|uniref:Uncharacterized protein n=1 Tax=Capsulimonas corticalis TaxID=2219043 RepID=A0A402CN48_9BACT|nr:hypothetical protein [Capsulimonas corticalis]BDI33385.1 hypothetical protein CCAX7_54360 [Capsulimonas corticalis]